MSESSIDAGAIPAVVAYLDKVEANLAQLSHRRRERALERLGEKIVAEIGNDIGVPHVMFVLAEFGTPEEQAEKIAGDKAGPAPEPNVAPERPAGFLERSRGAIATVLLLALGGIVIPVIGWLAGVVLLWRSRAWAWWDKVIGTAVLPGGFAAVLVGGFFPPRRYLDEELAAQLPWSPHYFTECSEITDGSETTLLCDPEPWALVRWAEHLPPGALFAILAVLQIGAIVYLLWRHGQWRKSHAELFVEKETVEAAV